MGTVQWLTAGELELVADPVRVELFPGAPTGIYVRARIEGTSELRAVDIHHLTRESLLAWLRSRGGDNALAENVVGHLLGHGGRIRDR